MLIVPCAVYVGSVGAFTTLSFSPSVGYADDALFSELTGRIVEYNHL